MNREDWNSRYRTEALVWTAEANCFVVAETADLPAGRVLDLAAGEGRNAVWLAERGWRATAVDYSDVGLDKAQRLAQSRGVALDTVVADVTTYDPTPHTYDLVLMSYVQLPEPDRSRVLGHAVDAVAPGGTLLIIAHDRSNLDGGYGGPRDPSVLATPDETARIVAELDVIKAELVERTVDTSDGPRVAIDHIVRAHRPI